MSKRRRSSRQPRASKRPSRVPPRRPGSRQRTPSGPNWKLIVSVGGGVIMLALVILVGTRVLGGSEPEPTATKAAVVATPTRPVAPTQALATPETAVPSPTTAPLLPTDTPPPMATPFVANSTVLQSFMHQLINQDRESHGLSALAWDLTAALAGTSHAREMSSSSYLSHWNKDGYGPDYRYTQKGGLDVVFENVYYYEHSPGAGPTSASDWQDIIREAQSKLMSSLGHQDNILAPEHTHVGVGIDYHLEKGRLSIAQEFVNRYVTLEPVPLGASLGETMTVQGRLLHGASAPLINLAYEAQPASMTAADLNETDTYQSPSEPYDSALPTVDSDGRFEQVITLNYEDQPGLYHVRVWVDTEFGQVLAVDVVITVR